MSLATRCTACGTVFRVVQDQLKVSEGWVRCGRCSEVFNALEGLFDLDREPGSDWSPDHTPAPGSQAAVDNSHPSDAAGAIASPQSSPPSHTSSQSKPDRAGQVELSDARFDPSFLGDDLSGHEHGLEPGITFGKALDQDSDASAPAFLRQAQRQARSHSTGMRVSLFALLILLLGSLALQGTHQFRDLIAARWPATKPALTAWCEIALCRIETPRRIDDVLVESSALARASASDAFKLSVTLRNRGSIPVALPSVDLSLTDPSGQLVARRVLTPRDFRAASAVMQPGADSPLQIVLATGSARVTGYTVEIFYP